MSNKLSLNLRLDQKLLMNQQLRQVIDILQASTVELKQQIEQHLETNFLLELDEEQEEETPESDYSYYDKLSRGENADDHLENIANKQTLRDYLLEQVIGCRLDYEDHVIAESIIDCIDEDGYLTASLDEISSVLGGCSVDKIESVLKVIHGLDIKGIGARTTQECLLLQLQQLPATVPHRDYAIAIVKTDMLTIDKFDLQEVISLTNLTEEQVNLGMLLIKELDFHPGRQFSDEASLLNEPELYVKKVNEKWVVSLAKSVFTRLTINNEYKKIIKENSRDSNYKSILEKLNEAKLLIGGIKRRNDTLLSVGKFIVAKQEKFMTYGAAALKPMNMAEAAEALECHESTISRITTMKYIKTPHGVFELKFFFPSSLKSNYGDMKSSVAVKSLIKELINAEGSAHVLSDDEIAEEIHKQGIKISRRTVAKYREAMNIPSSYVRAGMKFIKSQIEQVSDGQPIEVMADE